MLKLNQQDLTEIGFILTGDWLINNGLYYMDNDCYFYKKDNHEYYIISENELNNLNYSCNILNLTREIYRVNYNVLYLTEEMFLNYNRKNRYDRDFAKSIRFVLDNYKNETKYDVKSLNKFIQISEYLDDIDKKFLKESVLNIK